MFQKRSGCPLKATTHRKCFLVWTSQTKKWRSYRLSYFFTFVRSATSIFSFDMSFDLSYEEASVFYTSDSYLVDNVVHGESREEGMSVDSS